MRPPMYNTTPYFPYTDDRCELPRSMTFTATYRPSKL